MKKNKKGTLVAVIVLAVAAVFFAAFNLIGVRVETGKEELRIQALFFSETVKYSDIAESDIRESVAPGTRTMGVDAVGVRVGTFKNDEFGSYPCAVFTAQSKVLVLHKTDGSYVVFNVKDGGQLQKIAEEIQSRMAAK